MKRLYSLDLIRGVAIVGVVILHGLFRWTGASRILSGQEQPSSFISFVGLFFTMAGIFFIVSGIVNAFAMYKRVSTHRNTLKEILFGAFVTGGWIIFLNYVYRIFLSSGFDEIERVPPGVIIGALRTGSLVLPSPEKIIGPGALLLIGSTVILVVGVLAVLFRGGGHGRVRRDYMVLGLVGATVLLAAPFVRTALVPMVSEAIANQDYLVAFSLGYLAADLMPIFPYLGYGFFGAILGIALACGEAFRKIRGYTALFGFSWFVFGLVGILVNGGTGSGQSFRPDIIGWCFIRYMNLGLFTLFVLTGLVVLDFAPDERKEKLIRLSTPLRRFGRISLTVFCLEPIMAEFLEMIANLLFPGWNNELGYVALFGVMGMFIWWFLLKHWERKNFIGSLEWQTIKIIEKLSGKKSTRLNMKDL